MRDLERMLRRTRGSGQTEEAGTTKSEKEGAPHYSVGRCSEASTAPSSASASSRAVGVSRRRAE